MNYLFGETNLNYQNKIFVACFWLAFLSWGGVTASYAQEQNFPQSQDTLQLQEERITVIGKVVTGDSWDALAFTHIMVLNSYEGTVTDKDGRFEIEVDPSDTLLFSRVGFKKTAISLKDSTQEVRDFLLVFMPTQAVSLREVVIYANHPLMRQRGKAMKVPGVKSYDGPRIEPDPVSYSYKKTHQEGEIPTAGMGVTYEGLITAFASQFSKKEKEKKKYRELLEKAAERKAYITIKEKKLNKRIVQKVLEVNDQQAEDFMDYFQPNKQFVIRANEYDMILAIMRAYEDFKKFNAALKVND